MTSDSDGQGVQDHHDHDAAPSSLTRHSARPDAPGAVAATVPGEGRTASEPAGAPALAAADSDATVAVAAPGPPTRTLHRPGVYAGPRPRVARVTVPRAAAGSTWPRPTGRCQIGVSVMERQEGP